MTEIQPIPVHLRQRRDEDLFLHPSTFDYLRPTEGQMAKMERVRGLFKAFVEELEDVLPDGPDKAFIFRTLRTCAMWSNVSLTRKHDGTPRE